MKSSTYIKEVQVLNGCLAAVNQFLSSSIEKCKPIFQAIKKNETKFSWDKQCEASFQCLKAYLSSPPFITTSR